MDYSCLAFIDVSKGEETKQGNSFEVSFTSQIKYGLEIDVVGPEQLVIAAFR